MYPPKLKSFRVPCKHGDKAARPARPTGPTFKQRELQSTLLCTDTIAKDHSRETCSSARNASKLLPAKTWLKNISRNCGRQVKPWIQDTVLMRRFPYATRLIGWILGSSPPSVWPFWRGHGAEMPQWRTFIFFITFLAWMKKHRK